MLVYAVRRQGFCNALIFANAIETGAHQRINLKERQACGNASAFAAAHVHLHTAAHKTSCRALVAADVAAFDAMPNTAAKQYESLQVAFERGGTGCAPLASAASIFGCVSAIGIARHHHV